MTLDYEVVSFGNPLNQEGVPPEAGFKDAAVGFLDAIVDPNLKMAC